MLENAESSLESVDLFLGSISNSLEFFGFCWSDMWKYVTNYLVRSSSGFELFSSWVVDLSLLWLSFTAWEEDELGLVSVESLSVELQLLCTCVSSSVINGDSDCASKGGGQTCSFNLIEGETTTISDLSSVPLCGRRNDWAELLNWTWEWLDCLGDSALVSNKLLSWLIEVAFSSAVPMLSKMDVCYGVVVLDHCW